MLFQVRFREKLNTHRVQLWNFFLFGTVFLMFLGFDPQDAFGKSIFCISLHQCGIFWSYSNFLDICVTNICWKFQLPTYLLRNPKICQDQPRSKIFRVDSNVLFARNFLSNICMNETFCHVNFVTLLQSVFLQTTGPRETFLACYTRKWAPLSGCLNSLAGS